MPTGSECTFAGIMYTLGDAAAIGEGIGSIVAGHLEN